MENGRTTPLLQPIHGRDLSLLVSGANQKRRRNKIAKMIEVYEDEVEDEPV